MLTFITVDDKTERKEVLAKQKLWILSKEFRIVWLLWLWLCILFAKRHLYPIQKPHWDPDHRRKWRRIETLIKSQPTIYRIHVYPEIWAVPCALYLTKIEKKIENPHRVRRMWVDCKKCKINKVIFTLLSWHSSFLLSRYFQIL